MLASPVALPAAEPLKLESLEVGPSTYRQVTVLGANATDLYFKHAAGIANVKLKNLSPELQQQFDYDPKVAAAAEQKQLKEDAAFLEAVAQEIAARAQKAKQAAHDAVAISENGLADPISDQSPLGRPAPKLTTIKWLGETPETEGKAVLVFFWTTGSMSCRKAISEMNSYQKDFHDRLVVVGLSAQEEREVAAFGDVKIDFPLAADSKSTFTKAAGVTSVPQAMLIDAQRIVRYVGHPAALDAPTLERLLPKPAE